MSTTKEKIEIMQAFEDGKKVECTKRDDDNWLPIVVDNPRWEWGDSDYRVKAEPLECWVNVLEGEICSTCNNERHVVESYLGIAPDPDNRWTTRKFREVIE